jgi:hypothetical protein
MQDCALPAALFDPLPGGGRSVRAGPSLNFSIVVDSQAIPVAVLSATFSPAGEGDTLTVTTLEPSGNLTLAFSTAPDAPALSSFIFYDKNLLTLPNVVVNTVNPSIWAARGGEPPPRQERSSQGAPQMREVADLGKNAQHGAKQGDENNPPPERFGLHVDRQNKEEQRAQRHLGIGRGER